MSQSKQANVPGTKAKQAWQWLTHSQEWAGGAEVPLMMRLAKTTKIVNKLFEDRLGLSFSQMRILVEAQDPNGINQADLHKHYGIDPASITRTLQGMERDGLVTRRVDENDNRYMRVYVTEAGRRLTEAFPAQMAEFERQMVGGLTDEEILKMHSMLKRIEEAVVKGGE